MSKALTVFLVLSLLLAGTALTFGVKLFKQREALKNRTQKLEQAVISVTSRMAESKDPFIKAIDQKINHDVLKDYSLMDPQLQILAGVLANRYDELYLTKDDLKRTQDKLAATEAELARTRQELADARDEISRLTEAIAKKEAEIEATNQKIAAMETQLAGLKQDLDKLKLEVTKKDEEIASLNERIITLQAELEIYIAGMPNKPMPRGLSGKVVAVNSEWHFVVLDIGSAAGVQVQGELAVHRGDQLIGKVRIIKVDENTSVADVSKDWLKAPIQEGDLVLN